MKKRKPGKWKRALSILLVLAMILSMDMPMAVRAAEQDQAAIDEAQTPVQETAEDVAEDAGEAEAGDADAAPADDDDAQASAGGGTEVEDIAGEENAPQSEEEILEPEVTEEFAEAAASVSESDVTVLQLDGEKARFNDAKTHWLKFTAPHRGVYNFHADQILDDRDDCIYIYLRLYNALDDGNSLDSESDDDDLSILYFMDEGQTIYMCHWPSYYESDGKPKPVIDIYVTEETYSEKLTLDANGKASVTIPEQEAREVEDQYIIFTAPEAGTYRFKVEDAYNEDGKHSYSILSLTGDVLKKYKYNDYSYPKEEGTRINYRKLAQGDTVYVKKEGIAYRQVTVSLMKLAEDTLTYPVLQSDEGLEITVSDYVEHVVKFTAPDTASYRFRSGSPMTLYKDMNDTAVKTADETKGALVDKYVLDQGMEQGETVYLVITESCTLTVSKVTVKDLVLGEATAVGQTEGGQFQWFRFTAVEKGFYDVSFTGSSKGMGCYVYETMDSGTALTGRVVYAGYPLEYTLEMAAGDVRYIYVNALGDDGGVLTVSKRALSFAKNEENSYTFITGDRRLDIAFDPGYRSVNITANMYDADGQALPSGRSYYAKLYYREKKDGAEWNEREFSSLSLSYSPLADENYIREQRKYQLKAGTVYEVKVRLEIQMNSTDPRCVLGEFVSDGTTALEVKTNTATADYMLDVRDIGCLAEVHAAVIPEDAATGYIQWRVAGGKWQSAGSLGTYGEVWTFVNVLPETDYEFRIASELPYNGGEPDTIYKTMPLYRTGAFPIQVEVTVDEADVTYKSAKAKLRFYGFDGGFYGGRNSGGESVRFRYQLPYVDITGEEREAGYEFSLKQGETEKEIEREFVNLEAGKTYEIPISVAEYNGWSQFHVMERAVTFTTKASPLAGKVQGEVEVDETNEQVNYTVSLSGTEDFADDYEVQADIRYDRKGRPHSGSGEYPLLNKGNNWSFSEPFGKFDEVFMRGAAYEISFIVEGVIVRKEITIPDGDVSAEIELSAAYCCGAKLKVSLTGNPRGTYKVTARYGDKFKMQEVGKYGGSQEGELTDANGHSNEWYVYGSGTYSIKPGRTETLHVEIKDEGKTVYDEYVTVEAPAMGLDFKAVPNEKDGTEAAIAMKVKNPDDLFKNTYCRADVYLYYREKGASYWNYGGECTGDRGVEESYNYTSQPASGTVTLSGLKPQTDYEVMVVSDQWEGTTNTYEKYGEFQFTSGKAGSDESKYYTVAFNMGGHGSAIASQEVKEGGKVSRPADPVAAGWKFEGWYKEVAFTNPWNFDSDTVTRNITLYAKWTETFEPERITVTPEETQIAKGGTIQIGVEVQPAKAWTEQSRITYTSSDATVAAVAAGSTGKTCTVSALKPGTAVITAKLDGTELTASCRIVVIDVISAEEQEELAAAVGDLYFLEEADETLQDISLPAGWAWTDPEISPKANHTLPVQEFEAVYSREGCQSFARRLPVNVSRFKGAAVKGDDRMLQGQQKKYTGICDYTGQALSAWNVTYAWTAEAGLGIVSGADAESAVVKADTAAAGEKKLSLSVTVTDPKNPQRNVTKSTELSVVINDLTIGLADTQPASGAIARTDIDTSEPAVFVIDALCFDKSKASKIALAVNTTDTVKWTSTDAGVMTVDKNGIVTVKKPGVAMITAAVGDRITQVEIRVEDYMPVLENRSVTVYQYSEELTRIGLVEQNGDGIQTVAVTGAAAGTITAKQQDGEWVLTASGYENKATENLIVNVSTDKGGKPSYELKVTVDVTKPDSRSVKFKQTVKPNVFYCGDEEIYAEFTVTSSKYIIENVYTKSASGAYCAEHYDPVTGRLVMRADGLKQATLAGYDFNPVVYVKAKGYEEVPVKITVATQNKKPTLKLADAVFIPGQTDAVVDLSSGKAVLDTTGMQFETLENGAVTVSAASGRINVNYAGSASGKYKVKISKDSWTDAVTVSGKVSVFTAVQLNKLALEANRSKVTINLNQGYREPVVISASVKGSGDLPVSLTAKALKSGIDVIKIDGSSFEVMPADGAAKGSYKVQINGTVGGKAIKAVTVTVSLTNAAPDIKLSAKGSINIANRTATSIVYTPTIKNLPEDLTIEDVEIRTTLAGANADVFAAGMQNGKAVVTALPGAEIRAKKYNAAMTFTLDNGRKVSTNVVIQPANKLPKVKAKAVSANVYKTNVDRMAKYSLAVDNGYTISRVIVAPDKKGTDRYFTLNLNDDHTVDIALNRTDIKAGSYSLNCQVFISEADDSKPAAVKLNVIVK